jgi:hypothetical protein
MLRICLFGRPKRRKQPERYAQLNPERLCERQGGGIRAAAKTIYYYGVIIMKKIICGSFVLFGFCSIISAQDFNAEWLDSMVGYIGKTARNIPDDFKPNPRNASRFEKTSSSGIVELMLVNKSNAIEQIVWHKPYDRRSKMYDDFDTISASLTKKLGKPFLLDDENGQRIWIWNKVAVIMGIGGDAMEIGIFSPEGMGVTQEQFDAFANNFFQE